MVSYETSESALVTLGLADAVQCR